MKLNRNFVQISLTALITSAFFIIPMANTRTGLISERAAPRQRITWKQATDMQKEYLDFRSLRVFIPENDRHEQRQKLKGFTFPADTLREILDHNLSGETPDSVYFQFGQEGTFGDDFLGGLFRDSGHMRLVAVGVKNGKLLITEKTPGTGISVFDKADPCPPNCPE